MRCIAHFMRVALFSLCLYVPISFAQTYISTTTTTTTASSAKHHYHQGTTSGFAKQRPAAGVPVFIFNPKTHKWGLYNANGILLKTGAASGGKNYCPDTRRACRTPSGTFHVIAKKGASCKSSKFPIGKGGSPMPYCTFFTKNHAIHGSYDVRPYNASHGCIRVYPSVAPWIQKHLPMGSIVIVLPY